MAHPNSCFSVNHKCQQKLTPSSRTQGKQSTSSVANSPSIGARKMNNFNLATSARAARNSIFCAPDQPAPAPSASLFLPTISMALASPVILFLPTATTGAIPARESISAYCCNGRSCGRYSLSYTLPQRSPMPPMILFSAHCIDRR